MAIGINSPRIWVVVVFAIDSPLCKQMLSSATVSDREKLILFAIHVIQNKLPTPSSFC